MQFEKFFINNENGKVNGYHQRGRYENGKLQLSLDEKFGDNKLGDNKLDNKLETKPDDKLNYKNNTQNMSDGEFIKHCENRITNNVIFDNAYELKDKLRHSLENVLDEEVLNDFKILVDIINNKERNRNSNQTRKIIGHLINKYSNL